MSSALPLRTDYSTADLRRLAKRTKDNNQSRRLLSLAAVLDGLNRTDAARIGGMDRQTLRDWVHRFNQQGPDGLRDIHAGGVGPRLSPESLADLVAIVEAGPDREKDGVVRWRRVDLKRVVKERFGVEFCERYIGTILKRLGFSHMSARPRHPKQNGQIVEAFKNVWPAPSASESFEIVKISLLQRIRPRSDAPGQDGDTRVPVLIKLTASSAIF
jgi:transposase